MLSVSGWLDTLIVKAVLVLSPKESCAVTVIVLSPRCSAVVGVPLNDTVVLFVETVSHPDAECRTCHCDRVLKSTVIEVVESNVIGEWLSARNSVVYRCGGQCQRLAGYIDCESSTRALTEGISRGYCDRTESEMWHVCRHATERYGGGSC